MKYDTFSSALALKAQALAYENANKITAIELSLARL